MVKSIDTLIGEKKEFLLEFDQFKNVRNETGFIALALNVQTLLLTNKNTLPSDPSFGVGIKNFKFEYADTAELNTIKSEIGTQYSKYIDNPNVRSIEVEFLKHKDEGFTSLGVMILLNDGSNPILVFDRNKKTGTIFSKIYF